MSYEDKVEHFKRYTHRVMDLMTDAYKWKCLAKEVTGEEHQKYMSISNTLYELFMTEHSAIGKMFKDEV